MRLDQLRQLPFANVNNIDSSYSSCNTEGDQSFIEEQELIETWAHFDDMRKKHRANLKIGHINANGIAGFKFHEIKRWLLSGRLDILIISETKLDGTFPNSQFYVQGFRMSRKGRNIHDGGLMAFVRSDICFTLVKDLENLSAADRSRFKTESLILKVKVAKSWITIIGVYRPPSVPKSQWKMELNALFEAAATVTNDLIYVGDFNDLQL